MGKAFIVSSWISTFNWQRGKREHGRFYGRLMWARVASNTSCSPTSTAQNSVICPHLEAKGIAFGNCNSMVGSQFPVWHTYGRGAQSMVTASYLYHTCLLLLHFFILFFYFWHPTPLPSQSAAFSSFRIGVGGRRGDLRQKCLTRLSPLKSVISALWMCQTLIFPHSVILWVL